MTLIPLVLFYKMKWNIIMPDLVIYLENQKLLTYAALICHQLQVTGQAIIIFQQEVNASFVQVINIYKYKYIHTFIYIYVTVSAKTRHVRTKTEFNFIAAVYRHTQYLSIPTVSSVKC